MSDATVDFPSGPFTWRVGRDATSCHLVVDDPALAAHHATIERTRPDGPVLIRDELSFGGVYVNGQRVATAELRAGDRLDLPPSSWRCRTDGLELRRAPRPGARLDVVRVSRRAGEHVLVSDASFSALPGELLGVVGSSGSGKTSLLQLLVGAQPPDAGVVLVDGEDLYAHLDQLRPRIGYVPQSSTLHGNLTVEQAVRFSAQLLRPERLSPSELELAVTRACARASIAHRRGALVRTLSGGELKRANVASELVLDPPILLLDEPTSGLDPVLDHELMTEFREIAEAGTTVVVVTHSLSNIAACDRIVMMAPGGHVVFVGAPERAPSSLGATDLTRALEAVNADPAGWAARHRDSIQAQEPPFRSRRTSHRHVMPRSTLRQLSVCARRSWTLLLQDRRMLLSLLAQAPILGLILFAVAGSRSLADLDSGVQPAMTVVFGLVLVVVWLGMLNSVREVTKERGVYGRERLGGLRAGPYIGSKLFVLVPVIALQSVVLLLIVSLRTGLPPSGVLVHAGAELLLTMVLAGASGIGTGLLVSTLAGNEDRAAALVPYILVPQFLFAGVTFRIPESLDALQAATSAYWAISAMGSTADLCAHPFFGGATCEEALGVPFIHATEPLLTRWLVLGCMAGAGTIIAWAFLRSSDRALRYR